jgi:hypothetical protein
MAGIFYWSCPENIFEKSKSAGFDKQKVQKMKFYAI